MNKVDPFELPPMSDVSDLETKRLPGLRKLLEAPSPFVSDEYQAGYDDGFAAGYEQARMDATKPKDFDPTKVRWNSEFWEDIETGEKVFDADQVTFVLKEESIYKRLLRELVKEASPYDAFFSKAESAASHLYDRLDNPKNDGFDLVGCDTEEEHKQRLAFWFSREVFSGPYCAPTWGRIFSELAAVFFETGSFYDIYGSVSDRDSFCKVRMTVRKKYKPQIDAWKARQ